MFRTLLQNDVCSRCASGPCEVDTGVKAHKEDHDSRLQGSVRDQRNITVIYIYIYIILFISEKKFVVFISGCFCCDRWSLLPCDLHNPRHGVTSGVRGSPSDPRSFGHLCSCRVIQSLSGTFLDKSWANTKLSKLPSENVSRSVTQWKLPWISHYEETRLSHYEETRHSPFVLIVNFL